MKENKTQSINFLRGVPCEAALSQLVPLISKGYEKAIAKYGTDVLQYGHFAGFKGLRDEIGNMHSVDSNRVIAGNGGLEMISLFFKSLPLESTILVEQASYDRVLLDARRYGHQVTGVRLTPEGIDPDQFEALVKKTKPAAFYGIPFHHNPTGITYTKDNRNAVERICRENDMFCLWDICYQPLRYDGKINDPIEVSEWGPVLFSSFTKTISPGTKCGYLIIPDHYADHLTGIIANTRINPNLPTQAFIADFIASGQYDTCLEHLCRRYKPRMDALNAALGANFPETVSTALTGGFFATLTFGNISTDKEALFIDTARKNGVSIAAAWDSVAPDFRAEMKKKGLLIRLTFPAYEPETIEWGIATLKETADLFVDKK